MSFAVNLKEEYKSVSYAAFHLDFLILYNFNVFYQMLKVNCDIAIPQPSLHTGQNHLLFYMNPVLFSVKIYHSPRSIYSKGVPGGILDMFHHSYTCIGVSPLQIE